MKTTALAGCLVVISFCVCSCGSSRQAREIIAEIVGQPAYYVDDYSNGRDAPWNVGITVCISKQPVEGPSEVDYILGFRTSNTVFDKPEDITFRTFWLGRGDGEWEIGRKEARTVLFHLTLANPGKASVHRFLLDRMGAD